MNAHDLPGQPESLWIATTPITGYPILDSAVKADVAVLGGGIVGLTTAYLLQKAGKKVVLLEAERLCTGVTGNTTAKISSQHGPVYTQLCQTIGLEKARLYADANQQGIATIRAISEELQIDCGFSEETMYVYSEETKDVESLRQEAEASKQAGLPAAYLETTPLPYKVAGAVAVTGQARFHPRAYLLGVAEAFVKLGGQIFEQSRACEVEEGESCTVQTTTGSMQAQNVVLATHFPVPDRGLYFTRMHQHRSYVLGAYLDGEVPAGMSVSTEPEHTLRIQPTDKGPMLIIGGQGHDAGKGGDTKQRYRDLETWARKHFPIKEVAYRWSTQDNFTLDMVPFVGKDTHLSKHIYVATGFGGWGMAAGTAASLLLTDLILGKKNPWEELFDPARSLPAKKALSYVGQNAANSLQFVTDHLKKRPDIDLDSLKPGEGQLGKVSGQEVAAYRDHHGVLHTLSPNCTHLGCELTWNPAEESWDCPCHGSRFSGSGEVLNGPANTPLPAIETT